MTRGRFSEVPLYDPDIAPYYDPKTNEYNLDREDVSIFYDPFDSITFHNPFEETIRLKYETPLDDLGLVDHQRTLKFVEGLVPIGFKWGKKRRRHHWQHPEDAYRGDRPKDKPNSKTFRNLPINIAWIPLQKERTIHAVLNDPPVPDDWVIEIYNEYFNAVEDLHRSAKEIIEWQRKARTRRIQATNPEWVAKTLRKDQEGKDIEGKRTLRKKGRHHSMDFATSYARFKEVPLEHRIVDTGGSPEQVIRDLSVLLSPRYMNIDLLEAA